MNRLVLSTVGVAAFVTSIGSWAADNKAQREKIDRCSNAAYIAVKAVELSPDLDKQSEFLQSAVAALKGSDALGKTKPYEGEILGAYAVAGIASENLARPADARTHDWLIAQSASACTLWVKDPG